MSKFIILSTLLLFGCSNTEEQTAQDKETVTVDNDNVDEFDEVELEVTQEPEKPWEEYRDNTEAFREDAKQEVMYNTADAPEIENKIENAFQMDQSEHGEISAQWTVYLDNFIEQMQYELSDEYISKMEEVYSAIDTVEVDDAHVQQLIAEARKIRVIEQQN